MEMKFQKERKENPLLETTPPEAWIAAQIVPTIQQVRSKASVDESILGLAVQRYLRSAVVSSALEAPPEHLHRTVEPYLPKVKKLLFAIFDRGQSLRGILRLPPSAYTVREALALPKAGSRREAVLVQGIKEKWSDPRIAKELDDGGLKPKNNQYQSYRKMLEIRPQLFYAMKSGVKSKYLL